MGHITALTSLQSTTARIGLTGVGARRRTLLLGILSTLVMAVGTLVALFTVVLFSHSASASQIVRSLPLQAGQILDVFEPNDAPGQAKDLPPSGYISLTFMTTDGFFTDTDWFRFSLQSNQVITLTARRNTSSILITIDAFLSDGTTKTGTTIGSWSDAATVVVSNIGSAKTYYVQISNATDLSYGTYRIEYVFANLPTGLSPDPYEPNDTITEANVPTATRSTASFIAAGTRIDNLGFVPFGGRPVDEADWFLFYGHSGSVYQATTLDVRPGVETVLAVYQPVIDPNNPTLALVTPLPGSSNPNNRYQPGQRGSQVTFQVPNGADGIYWIRVTNLDPLPRVPGQSYSLALAELPPSLRPRVYLPIMQKL